MPSKPHNHDAERSLIGSILLESNRTLYVCARLGITLDSFDDPALRLIYKAIDERSRMRGGIDTTTVSEQLKANGDLETVGGSIALDNLIDDTPTAAHAEHYGEIVKTAENRRKALTIIGRVYEDLQDESCALDSLLNEVSCEMQTLMPKSGLEIKQLKDYKDERIAQWRTARGQGFIGIPSSFSELNKILGGYRRGIMSIIGAYRGTGKSTYARQEAFGIAKQDYKVALFSLEDPGEMASAGIVGNHAGVSVFNLDTGQLGEEAIERMAQGFDQLGNLPLWIVSHPMTIGHITSTAKLLKARHGIDWLGIDHIQFITPYMLPQMSRNDTMAVYSQQIVNLAKDLNIHISCTSQLSRDSEKNSRNPKLSDLRDSGTLEADARQVMLLRWDKEQNCHVLAVEKNNAGKTGEVPLILIGDKQRFESKYSR